MPVHITKHIKNIYLPVNSITSNMNAKLLGTLSQQYNGVCLNGVYIHEVKSITNKSEYNVIMYDNEVKIRITVELEAESRVYVLGDLLECTVILIGDYILGQNGPNILIKINNNKEFKGIAVKDRVLVQVTGETVYYDKIMFIKAEILTNVSIFNTTFIFSSKLNSLKEKGGTPSTSVKQITYPKQTTPDTSAKQITSEKQTDTEKKSIEKQSTTEVLINQIKKKMKPITKNKWLFDIIKKKSTADIIKTGSTSTSNITYNQYDFLLVDDIDKNGDIIFIQKKLPGTTYIVMPPEDIFNYIYNNLEQLIELLNKVEISDSIKFLYENL